MAVTNTDAALHYNVGIFGELGYAVPNWSNDAGTLNPNIWDFVDLVGQNLFSIMHHEDADLRVPPSINTLTRVHQLYKRAAQILSGRAVPPNKLNLETKHVQPGGEFFRLYPIPYFKVRNNYLRRWSGLVLMSLAEAMQHTENRKTIEISTTFAGLVGQYLRRVYVNMSVECFGKSQEVADAPDFMLTEEDLASYDPTKWFTSTELVDTVPDLSHVFTEDSLEVLRQGILTFNMPTLAPYPTNLTHFNAVARATFPNPEEHGTGGGGSAAPAASFVIPPAPGP